MIDIEDEREYPIYPKKGKAGGEPLAWLVGQPSQVPAIRQALERRGYRVTDQAAEPPTPGEPACTIEDSHPCDVSIAAGYLHQTAQQLGIPEGYVAEAVATGSYGEMRLKEALIAIRAQLPADEWGVADQALKKAWPDYQPSSPPQSASAVS